MSSSAPQIAGRNTTSMSARRIILIVDFTTLDLLLGDLIRRTRGCTLARLHRKNKSVLLDDEENCPAPMDDRYRITDYTARKAQGARPYQSARMRSGEAAIFI